MVQAMVFEKTPEGAIGQFHSCNDVEEAWEWVRKQNKQKKNVLVLTEKEDIEWAWKLFGANRRNSDDAEGV